MKTFFYRKVPEVLLPSFVKGGNRALFLKEHSYLCDLMLLLFVGCTAYGFFTYFCRYSEPLQAEVEINLSPLSLPKYTFFSMSRGLLGYILSLIFSLIWGFWAAKDRAAEKVLIPTLDVLQSIPILGFMPALILFFVGLFPHNNMGLELAAILMLFTSQAWNMAFGVYHSIRIIPQDKIECAEVYGLSIWQRIKWLEIPYTIISLVWNSIMSMAGGWFFLVVNEAFQLGNRDFRLPGLGSYMSVAVAQGDIAAICSAIVAMIIMIVFLDTCLWKPLVMWSQKFRVEDTSATTHAESLFFQIISYSFVMIKLGQGLKYLKKMLSKIKTPSLKMRISPLVISRGCLILFIAFLVIAIVYLIKSVSAIAFLQWMHLGHMTLLTFARVLLCLVLATLIALPLGLFIGLSETLSKKLEPLIQITASFPATLLFPLMILIFHKLRIALNVGSVILMLMGTLWYVLFNVIAGAKAMPLELKEVMAVFRFNSYQKFLSLYLPSIFPYLITGLVTAAGGAWNASIVAEYISYKDKIMSIPGIGSMINISAQEGHIPLLTASILVMASAVVLLNYQVWLRLFHYSEKRFSLNY